MWTETIFLLYETIKKHRGKKTFCLFLWNKWETFSKPPQGNFYQTKEDFHWKKLSASIITEVPQPSHKFMS